jgi:hypothetical protein
MRLIGFVNVILSAALASGCHISCCSKRVSEKKCPTDIRKTHCWCFGEDALFRYPCGPNQVFYGHKATCWREWPTSASQWRDMHCGPPMQALAAQEGQVVPSPHIAEPSPAGSELPNPFGDETPQSDHPPQAETPIISDHTSQEPNALPATPEIDGQVQPATPEVPQAAPAQPMPDGPSNSDAQPMANLEGGPQLEFQPWPAFTALDETPSQRHESPPPQVKTLPAIAEKPVPVVAVKSQPAVGDPLEPVVETRSRWRLVVHDNPDVLPTSSQAETSRFRPPNHVGSPPAAGPRRDPPAAKPTLEEQTGNALRLFISDETQPGKE